MNKIVLVFCLVVCCLFFASSCDKDDGSGGGQTSSQALSGIEPQDAGDKTVPVARLTGPDSTAAQYTTFECGTKDAGTSIIGRQWEVTGGGSIVGADNQAVLKVKAASSGSYTVRLRVLSPEKVWSHWAQKNVTVDFPGFVITPGPLDSGNAMSGWPARGSASTLTMTGEHTAYQNYTITFEGDTSGLSSQVSVTVTWNMLNANWFRWAGPHIESGTHTFLMPATGGSIGLLGTVVYLSSPRPYIGFAGAGTTVGTVTYEAPGVDPLAITVVRP